MPFGALWGRRFVELYMYSYRISCCIRWLFFVIFLSSEICDYFCHTFTWKFLFVSCFGCFINSCFFVRGLQAAVVAACVWAKWFTPSDPLLLVCVTLKHDIGLNWLYRSRSRSSIFVDKLLGCSLNSTIGLLIGLWFHSETLTGNNFHPSSKVCLLWVTHVLPPITCHKRDSEQLVVGLYSWTFGTCE